MPAEPPYDENEETTAAPADVVEEASSSSSINENDDDEIADGSSSSFSKQQDHDDALLRAGTITKTKYRLALASNFFFLVASILYVCMSSIDVRFVNMYSGVNEDGVNTNYSVMYWNQLPPEAQEAASVLGYDQKSWDANETPEESNTWYECLTPEQQEAAAMFGYEKAEDWNGPNAPAEIICPEDTTSTTKDASSSGGGGEDYYNMAWNDLPPEAQQAAKVLGYDQQLWDSDFVPAEIDVYFECLTPEQQAAAKVLGYDTAAEWNGPDAPAEIVCTEEEEDADASSSGGGLDYYNMAWNELPPEAQQAAQILGYDQQMWDSGLVPAEIDVYFECLTPEQQDAAKVLGYDTAAEWNGPDAPAEIVCSEEEEDEDADASSGGSGGKDYYNMAWNELPPEAQEAAKVLGYDQQMWDSGLLPAEIDVYFECLTPEQQAAAKILGYDTAAEWNGPDAPLDIDCNDNEKGEEEDGTDDPDQEQTPILYYNLPWNELPLFAKKAANVLGYDEALWDSGGTPPESDALWDDLTPEQRIAAMLLGYNEQTWNGVRRLQEEATSVTPTEYVAQQDSQYAQDKRYSRLYIFASWFFVVVGLLDWVAIRKLYPLLFVIAGLFGFVSALYLLTNVRFSNIFNAVSIHFYFLEVIVMAWYRFHEENEYHIALKCADFAFFLGATIELVLSYIYIFDEMSDFRMEVAAFNTVAQSLWVVCALIYITFTIKSRPAMLADTKETDTVKKSSAITDETWRDEDKCVDSHNNSSFEI